MLKAAVTLKYISKFCRSLEIPLINYKVHLDLNWSKNSVLSSAGTSETLKITDAKLSVPVVTLSSIGNVKLAKQLSVGFKRFVYSNEY